MPAGESGRLLRNDLMHALARYASTRVSSVGCPGVSEPTLWVSRKTQQKYRGREDNSNFRSALRIKAAAPLCISGTANYRRSWQTNLPYRASSLRQSIGMAALVALYELTEARPLPENRKHASIARRIGGRRATRRGHRYKSRA